MWRVDILKTHNFEPFEGVDLLANSPRLRVFQIRAPAGAKRAFFFSGSAGLIFNEGGNVGGVGSSSRSRGVDR